jgi:hypothetical protein
MAADMVRRAIARGEVPPETDPRLVAELLIAPIYFRLLMSGDDRDAELVERLADLVDNLALSPGA